MSVAVRTSAAAGGDRVELVRAHRHRDVGVLDGERAAEAAALVGARQVDEAEPVHGPEQPARPVADLQQPERVAGRVQRDRPIELAPTSVTPRSSTSSSLSSRTPGHAAPRPPPGAPIARIGGEDRVVEADHRGARRGGRDDPVVRLELRDEPADDAAAPGRVAGVEVHLAAARLVGRELDGHPEPLEHPDGRLSDLREEQVVEAGDEQGDPRGRPTGRASPALTEGTRPRPRRRPGRGGRRLRQVAADEREHRGGDVLGQDLLLEQGPLGIDSPSLSSATP